MSTQSPYRPTAKAAAKKRAANRRRNRERIRQFAAIFFVAIFVLGGATIASITQQAASQQTSGSTTTSTPAATTTEVPATATPNSAVEKIIEQGDQAAAKGDWKTAAGFYKAALGLSSGNATIYFKVGKALGNTGDYPDAANDLQQALDLNPSASFAAEAKTLLDTYKAKVTPGSGMPIKGSTPATGTITATQPITK